jgi:hypothetical protein
MLTYCFGLDDQPVLPRGDKYPVLDIRDTRYLPG